MAEFTLYQHAGQRGIAEKIRFMLQETGQKYDDVAVDAATFAKMKEGKLLTFNVLPVLQRGDQIKIEQSTNILEYVADLADKCGKGSGKNKYCGADSAETYKIRAIALAAHDFEMESQTWKGKEGAPANIKDVIAKWFTHFETILEANDDGDVRTEEWTYGKHFTFGDIAVFASVNNICEVHGLSVVRPYRRLKAFHDLVAGRARIERHIATRPAQA